jgi:GntR family transcriptional regulator
MPTKGVNDRLNNKDIININHRVISELEKDTRIPLYYQIELFLKEQISSGELKPGDQILTEEKLCQKFGVSRATVRRAIADLVYEGLLERNYSKGTYVTQPKITQGLFEATSFTSAILKSGKILTTKILKFRKVPSDDYLRKKLPVEKDDYLYFIKRVRYVDDMPVCVEELYIPEKYVPGFSIDLFEGQGLNQSTYHVLQQHYNIVVKRVNDTMSAVSADDKDAVLLDVEKNSPVLLRQRISYDAQDRPLSFSSGRYIIKINISF